MSDPSDAGFNLATRVCKTDAFTGEVSDLQLACYSRQSSQKFIRRGARISVSSRPLHDWYIIGTSKVPDDFYVETPDVSLVRSFNYRPFIGL